MKNLLSLWLLIPSLLVATYSVNAHAEDLNVAVAANFIAPMQEIAKQFESATHHHLILSSGATGKFYSQIKNGAPFQVLLAADDETPKRLEAEGEAITNSRFTYAVGRLALWSQKIGYVDAKGRVLHTGNFAHLSIANPKVAPYGTAAVQTMQTLKVSDRLASKVVQGESIAQAFQFVESGAAELGFVAYSQVIANPKITGTYWVVPEKFHEPIVQQAVLLKNAKGNPAAQQLMQFLKSKNARAIIRRYGYDANP